ncbi:MAG TPA: serine/threonine protein phosphatase [Spirochaetes bacterium]|nr:serine/threonine protein phosphatase [Spirochaetota bacterium]
MYYVIGDIHGCFSKITALYGKISSRIGPDDWLIFLGDYIDRGEHSFEVVEFLIGLGRRHPVVFIKGNHESMFMDYLAGKDIQKIYYQNGGERTVDSYTRQFGYFHVPGTHRFFFNSLRAYFEEKEFIAVHAGLNPKIYIMESQNEEDMIWIREKFFRSPRKWEKTVIFGHTPTAALTGGRFSVYRDPERNIIGIDTGAVYGGTLTCLRWPDMAEFHA